MIKIYMIHKIFSQEIIFIFFILLTSSIDTLEHNACKNMHKIFIYACIIPQLKTDVELKFKQV